MRKYIFILISAIFCFSGMSIFGNPATSDRHPDVKGFIDIIVESNVNKLSFSYPISSENINNESRRSANIVVPVKDFKCSNKTAFRDFLELLKANEYPNITIQIPASVISELENKESVTMNNVMIDIAGVSKRYDVIIKPDNNKSDYLFRGTIKVVLSDFNIEPPVKYFGMVKIKDEVVVNFGIGLKEDRFASK
jgi:hypothetical protein